MSAELLMTRHGTLVTVTDDGAADVYGNPTETTTQTSVWYELQQARRSEDAGDTSWQIGIWNLFLPPGTEVAGVDRFIGDESDTYEFVGPPWKVRNPRTGIVSHIEATIRRAQ